MEIFKIPIFYKKIFFGNLNDKIKAIQMQNGNVVLLRDLNSSVYELAKVKTLNNKEYSAQIIKTDVSGERFIDSIKLKYENLEELLIGENNFYYNETSKT